MWEIGDRAILVSCEHPENEGLHCEIVAKARTWKHYDGIVRWAIECSTGTWDAAAYNLRPIPDSYNGLSVTTWDKCPMEFHPDNFKVTV